MTSKEFAQVIRRIVQEEVQRTVRKEIQVMLNESKNNTFESKITDHFEPRVNVKPRPAKQPKQYSKNPMLNELLNETAPMQRDGNYITEAFAAPDINYNDYDEWPSMRSMPAPRTAASMIPTTDTEGRPIHNVHVPEEVASALTRDYSSLMKAINKKKGG